MGRNTEEALNLETSIARLRLILKLNQDNRGYTPCFTKNRVVSNSKIVYYCEKEGTWKEPFSSDMQGCLQTEGGRIIDKNPLVFTSLPTHKIQYHC